MTTTLRAPGVYRAPDENRYVQIQLGDTGVPGFYWYNAAWTDQWADADRLGGALPTRLRRAEEGGDSLYAAKGFFANGGRQCYILRVAHMVRRLREETARMASLKLKDGKEDDAHRLRDQRGDVG